MEEERNSGVEREGEGGREREEEGGKDSLLYTRSTQSIIR